jgi:hypothetical protein
MNNADYQLRHSTLGRHGSFWGYQTDLKTRDMLRELSRTAAIPSRLQHIDAGAAYALGAQKILKEDLVIGFQDGEFAVVGPDMQAYVADDISPGVYTMIRDNAYIGQTNTLTPRPHRLSAMTQAQVTELSFDVPELTAAGTWYLIPKPADINPISLSTKKPGVNLAYGVDFFTSTNFIITQLPPAEYFESGAIVVSVAEVSLESFESYVSDSPRQKKSRKWVNTYARRAQSPELFRRAAAEFCGLYVLSNDDVLLNTSMLQDGTYIYAFASAGVVHIDYPHTPLAIATTYPAGYVVCDKFELRNSRTHGAGFLISTGAPIDLSGLLGLPLQLPSDGLVSYSYAYVSQSLKTHVRLYMAGTAPDLQMMWSSQMAHEQRTDLFLSTQLGHDNPVTFPSGGSFPPVVDFASRLRAFYGDRLTLLVVDGLPDKFRFELHRFLNEHSPVGTVILLADMDATVLGVLSVAAPPGSNTQPPAGTTLYDTEPLP